MTLSDTALLAAEEAYDTVIRAEGSRSPYMNTRAFRVAFELASAVASLRASIGTGAAEGESAGPKDDAQKVSQ